MHDTAAGTSTLPSPQDLLLRLGSVVHHPDPRCQILELIYQSFAGCEITFIHRSHRIWTTTLPSGESTVSAILDDAEVERCLADKSPRESSSHESVVFPLLLGHETVGAVRMKGALTSAAALHGNYGACFTLAALMLGAEPAAPSITQTPAPGKQPAAGLPGRQHILRRKKGMRRRIPAHGPLTLITKGPVGILQTDGRGKCIFINQACCALLGINHEQAAGRGWSTAMHPLDRKEFRNSWREAWHLGRNIEGVWRILRPDGTTQWVQAQAVPTADSVGKVTGFFAAILDISEHKRIQEQITEQNCTLERQLALATTVKESLIRESERICYSMSHDLRAPLRAISGYAEILMEEQLHLLEPRHRETLANIASRSVQMGRLIDDLLAYAQLGRQQPRQSRVDLEHMVATMLRQLLSCFPEKQVQWVIGKLPPVRCDQEMMGLALKHLLENALKFTRHRALIRIEVGSYQTENEKVIYVRDNGIGFDNKYQHKVFGVFDKLHPADEYEGTGVGLAMVQRVVGKHGGRVWAEGVMDEGATFYLAFPSPECNSTH